MNYIQAMWDTVTNEKKKIGKVLISSIHLAISMY